jgi:hypothetical protein
MAVLINFTTRTIKMYKSIFALAVSAIAIGCVSGTAEESALCKTSMMTFDPGVMLPNVAVPMIESSTLLDVSGSISKLSDVGNVNANITQNLLKSANGNLNWISHVLVMVESSKEPQTYPQVKLADYTLTATDKSTGTVNVPTLLDGATLLKYLSQGEVKLTFGVAGSLPQQPINLTSEVCLDASLQLSKSL